MVAVGLAGCASRPIAEEAKAPVVPETPSVAETGSAAPAAPAKPAKAAAPLDPEVMYKILVAEVAIQRGQYDLAIKNYLELGKAQRDPRLLERAARISVYAHDNQHALQAAKLWVELEPNNIEAREIVTAFYIRNGQYDEAQ